MMETAGTLARTEPYVLAAAASGVVDLIEREGGDVAKALELTSWTLQRRLKDLDVNFNDLVRAARRDLALRYVAEPHIPLTEVAFLLGYSGLSAFSRAFRQWTDMAPARYRRHHGRG